MTGIAVLVALALGLVACADSGAQSPTADRRELVVFAASSLTDAFRELASAFEAQRGDVAVQLNFAGSQVLATQILEGATADVFAAADAVQIERLSDAGHLDADAVVFATNRLTIAVEAGNPRGVRGLADLSHPHLLVVLPAETVPAGRYARELLGGAGVEVTPASLEQDVRGSLAKVALGEADAAVVFATDVAAAPDRVEEVPIPPSENVVAAYPIAVLAEASATTEAAAFVDFVRSAAGQQILAEHGFGTP